MGKLLLDKMDPSKKLTGKRRASEQLAKNDMGDANVDDSADGPLADGSAGLTADGTRDLGTMYFGDGGEGYEGEDNEEMDGDEDEDDFEDEDEDLHDADEYDEGSAAAGGAQPGSSSLFIPGRDTIPEGETLDYDPSAYQMYHALTTEWSCLSFDVMPDRQGPARTKFPLTATIVAGTQADKASSNKLLVMRVSNLVRTQELPDDNSEDEEDSDEEDEEPVVHGQSIPHPGAVNRVRVMTQEPHVVATWSETGRVLLWDTRSQIRFLDSAIASGAAGTTSGAALPVGAGAASSLLPITDFRGHSAEGWALDWSPVQVGRLATGGCDGRLFVLDADAGAAATAMKSALGTADMGAIWKSEAASAYTSHTGSVEDLQWSPNEANVLSSCGTDGSVRIWDTRTKSRSMLQVAGSSAGVDINVISWSKRVAFLLASGDDAGGFKVWDLRNFKSESPVASFTWHRGPLYALEWDPSDENCLLAASGDGSVTLWDMSLEADDEAEAALGHSKTGAVGGLDGEAMPPQLLFVHAGQNDVREAHFHPQLPGVVVSTAADGINVWKPDVVTTT